ncbi:MAG: universal stress protein [Flavobacteriales bacterium]|nr:universal stress protein [Flavobacteriales bacterium]
MKTLLVPTDFTEYADFALEVAASISKKTGAKIYLLNVIDKIYRKEDGSYNRYEDVTLNGITEHKEVDKRFNERKKKYQLQDVELLKESQFDTVYGSILKYADQYKADLIIMGAYGNSGSEESFIGSNTERVMRNSSIPVLTIKQRYENFNINNIVFASLFLSEAKRIFPKLKSFAELFNAKIHLLKVITPARFERTPIAIALMNKFAAEFNLKDYAVNLYADNSVEGGIINFSNEVEADIIAITTHGKRRLTYLINGNLTDEVVNESAKAILSFRVRDVLEEISEEFRENYRDYYYGSDF